MDRRRVYDAILRQHLSRHRQMAFVAGPRQVGKTTACRALASSYLDWDNSDHRRTFLEGPTAVARALGLETLRADLPVAVFDEIYKFARWKSFLKGFFDTWGDRARLLITGSSRLDVYRRGGDSLFGRYLLYRMHPFSVAEIVDPSPPTVLPRPPAPISDDDWAALMDYGGFPEPFTKREPAFSNRWRALRRELLLRQDIRDLTRVQELGQIEILGRLLEERSGSQVVYSNLAREVQVSVDTIRRWIATLTALHVGFLVRPWFRNVAKAIRKEPKWFLWDWSGIADRGARTETLVACHLLKAVEGWTDLGLGEFQLGYLRDKEKREVDFVVVRDGQPWFLVEVKTSEERLSPALGFFQEQTGAGHAFQAVFGMAHVQADCFGRATPTVVPLRTLLSQLF